MTPRFRQGKVTDLSPYFLNCAQHCQKGVKSMNYIHIYVLLYINPLCHDCHIINKDAMEWEDVKMS